MPPGFQVAAAHVLQGVRVHRPRSRGPSAIRAELGVSMAQFEALDAVAGSGREVLTAAP